MIKNRCSNFYFLIFFFAPFISLAQLEDFKSNKLNIVYQAIGEKKDTIELTGQDAAEFDIPTFLARHSRSRVLLNGSQLTDNGFEHFGYDSKLYSASDKACKQFCPTFSSIRKAPFLGITTISRDDFEGEIITGVVPGSAADQAGLLPGDIILFINDMEIRSSCDLTKEIANETSIGDTIIVEIERAGEFMIFEVIMGFKLRKTIMWKPCCDGAFERETVDRSLHLFPNPADDYTQYQYSSTKNLPIKIMITDVTGRHLFFKEINDFQGSVQAYIDLARFASGLYFFSVIQENQSIVERLVIQRL